MAANGIEIVKRYEHMKNRRQPHETRWRRHSPYMSPWSYGIGDDNLQTEGQATQTQVYNSTAIFANDILANFIAGEIINPAEKYVSYKHPDEQLNKIDEVKEWAEECTDRVLREVNRSNFHTEAPSMIAGVTGFGSGSLFRGERLRDVSEKNAVPGFRGFRFKCDKIGRFALAEDQNGEIKTNFREFIYTAGQCAERWGRDKLPAKVKECITGNKLEEKFTILHAVYPRASGDRAYGNRGMPWASCYVELSEKHVLEEGGFERYPFTNPRWDVIPGEVYGRCPGDIAFNDVLTVNAADKLDLESWALDARPPTFARNDMGFGTINLVPGMFMSVRVPPQTRVADSFHHYTSGATHEINELREQKKIQAINQAYYVDQILQMLQVEKTQMTAYEFRRKLELLFRILGPVYGRFQGEFLKPTFDGIIEDMAMAGKLPPSPDEVVEWAIQNGRNKIDIDLEFNNPLAKAQKTVEVDAINFAIADLTPLITLEMQAKGYSDAFDRINPGKTAVHIFDVRGVPATLVNSDKEVEQIQQARAAAQAEQRQKEEAMMTAEAAGKAAPALELLQGNKAA